MNSHTPQAFVSLVLTKRRRRQATPKTSGKDKRLFGTARQRLGTFSSDPDGAQHFGANVKMATAASPFKRGNSRSSRATGWE